MTKKGDSTNQEEIFDRVSMFGILTICTSRHVFKKIL